MNSISLDIINLVEEIVMIIEQQQDAVKQIAPMEQLLQTYGKEYKYMKFTPKRNPKQCVPRELEENQMIIKKGIDRFFVIDKQDVSRLFINNNEFINECVRGSDTPCRMFFDIDINTENAYNLINKHLYSAVRIIGRVFNQSYCTSSWCTVYSSSNANKLSLHIVLKQSMSGIHHAKTIVEHMKQQYIGNPLIDNIDLSVYRPNTCLRIPLSAKEGSNRFKTRIIGDEELLLQNCNKPTLFVRQIMVHNKWMSYRDIYLLDEEGSDGDIDDDDFYRDNVDLYSNDLGGDTIGIENHGVYSGDLKPFLENVKVANVMKDYFVRSQIELVSGRVLIELTKIQGRQVKCIVCKNIHDGNDNVNYLAFDPSKYCGWINCRRVKKGIIVKLGYSKERLEQKTMRALQQYQRVLTADTKDCFNFNRELWNEESYSDVYYIQAPMGVGKTINLIDYVSTSDHSQVVVYISYRVSLTTEMYTKFKKAGCRVYNYLDGLKGIEPLDGGITVIIIQWESLHKLQWHCNNDSGIFKNYNTIVVCDETISILEQMSSNICNDKKFKNITTLRQLIKITGRLVCMDAYMDDHYAALFDQTMCIDYTQKQRTQLVYTIQPTVKKDLFIYSNPCKVLQSAIQSLKQNKKVVFCSNSKAICEKMYASVVQYMPSKKAKIVTGDDKSTYSGMEDMNHKVKKVVYRDVSSYLKDGVDIFIFSPCIQAGVSIECQDFQNVFCVFSNGSCSPLSCLQMVGRTRNCKYLHIYCSSRKREQIVTMNDKIYLANKSLSTCIEDFQWIRTLAAGLYQKETTMFDDIIGGIGQYLSGSIEYDVSIAKMECNVEEVKKNCTVEIAEEMTKHGDTTMKDGLINEYSKQMKFYIERLNKLGKKLTDEEIMTNIATFMDKDLCMYIRYYIAFSKLQLHFSIKDDKDLMHIYHDITKLVGILDAFKKVDVDIVNAMFNGEVIVLDSQQSKVISTKLNKVKWIEYLKKFMCLENKKKDDSRTQLAKRRMGHQLTFYPLSEFFTDITSSKPNHLPGINDEIMERIRQSKHSWKKLSE